LAFGDVGERTFAQRSWPPDADASKSHGRRAARDGHWRSILAAPHETPLPSPQAVDIDVLSIPRTIPESHVCYKKAADACACVASMLSRGLSTSEMHCYTETMPRTQCTLASCAPILRIRCRCCITRGHCTRGIVRSNATFCSQFFRPRKSCPSGSTHRVLVCLSILHYYIDSRNCVSGRPPHLGLLFRYDWDAQQDGPTRHICCDSRHRDALSGPSHAHMYEPRTMKGYASYLPVQTDRQWATIFPSAHCVRPTTSPSPASPRSYTGRRARAFKGQSCGARRGLYTRPAARGRLTNTAALQAELSLGPEPQPARG
jgi:hypothetical protein